MARTDERETEIAEHDAAQLALMPKEERELQEPREPRIPRVRSKSDAFAKFAEDHKLFRRSFVILFCSLCVQMHFWLQRMVEMDKIEGEILVTVYASALVGGFVAIVVGYANAGTKNGG